MYNPDERPKFEYPKHLEPIAAQDVAIVKEKDEQYGASWLEYGGFSAFFATVRKWDRIRVQLKRVGWDVFEAYARDNRQEGFMDDVRDLRRYLLLWEARAVELGLVPADQQYFQFGKDMFIADEERLKAAFQNLLAITQPDTPVTEDQLNEILDKVRAVPG